MKSKTQVMFRVSFNEVFAVFPYEVDYNGDTLMFKNDDFIGCQYDHTIKTSKPAFHSQSLSLYQTLERLGYNLEVIRARSFAMYMNACQNAKPNTVFN